MVRWHRFLAVGSTLVAEPLHPGFSLGTGENLPNSNNYQTPSKARWARSVFHWYSHLAVFSAPSIGLEDVTAHIEALTNFSQLGLNDSQQPVLTEH